MSGQDPIVARWGAGNRQVTTTLNLTFTPDIKRNPNNQVTTTDWLGYCDRKLEHMHHSQHGRGDYHFARYLNTMEHIASHRAAGTHAPDSIGPNAEAEMREALALDSSTQRGLSEGEAGISVSPTQSGGHISSVVHHRPASAGGWEWQPGAHDHLVIKGVVELVGLISAAGPILWPRPL